MVPQVPICTYAHVREGNMQFAERVDKKNWDQVGPGPDGPRHGNRTSRGK